MDRKEYIPYFFTIFPFIFGLVIALSANSNIIRNSFGEKYAESPSNKQGDLLWTLAITMFPLGGVLGSVLVPILPKCVKSRKALLVITNVIGMLGSIFYITSFRTSIFVFFCVARFIFGLVSGLIMALGIISFFEMVNPKQINIASTLIQPAINIGIVVSSVMNLNSVLNDNWIIAIAPLIITQIICFIGIIIIPESPSYVVEITRNTEQAVRILKQIRGHKWDVYREVSEIQDSIKNSAAVEKVTFCSFLCNPDIRKAIIVTALISAGQQLSGINAVVLYAANFVSAVGIKQVDVGVTILMLLGLLGSIIFAIIIPRVGNKPMMVYGHLMMALCFIIACYFSVHKVYPLVGLIFLSLYLFFFQSGPGSLPFVIFKSTFELKYQAPAQALVTSVNWVANVIVTAFSLPVLNALNIDVLLFFGCLNLVFAVIFQLFMVETKNKTYTQIIEDYKA